MLNKLFIEENNNATKESFLESISDNLYESAVCESSSELYKGFLKREESGNTLISENIAMPHVESILIKQSTICFVNLSDNPVVWNANNRVRFVIVLCVNNNEKIEILDEIKCFMRKLADEDFEQKLIKCKSLIDVRKII